MDHEGEIHNTLTGCMVCKVSISIHVEVNEDETL